MDPFDTFSVGDDGSLSGSRGSGRPIGQPHRDSFPAMSSGGPMDYQIIAVNPGPNAAHYNAAQQLSASPPSSTSSSATPSPLALPNQTVKSPVSSPTGTNRSVGHIQNTNVTHPSYKKSARANLSVDTAFANMPPNFMRLNIASPDSMVSDPQSPGSSDGSDSASMSGDDDMEGGDMDMDMGPDSPLSPEAQLNGLTKTRKVRRRVKNACTNCKMAKTKCDMQRPCGRCRRRGQESCCVDTVHKRRGRKRGLEDMFMMSAARGAHSMSAPNSARMMVPDDRRWCGSPPAMTSMPAHPHASIAVPARSVPSSPRSPKLAKTHRSQSISLAGSPVAAIFAPQSRQHILINQHQQLGMAMAGPGPTHAVVAATLPTAAGFAGQHAPPMAHLQAQAPVPAKVFVGHPVAQPIQHAQPPPQMHQMQQIPIQAHIPAVISMEGYPPPPATSNMPNDIPQEPEHVYLETLLSTFKNQLERWAQRLNYSPAALPASDWLSSNLCKLVQSDGCDEGGNHEGEMKTRLSDKDQVQISNRLKTHGFDSDKIMFKEFARPVMLYSLEPLPFHPGSKLWLNDAALNLLGFTREDVRLLNDEGKAFSAVWHVSNIETAARRFMDTISTARDTYSSKANWMCRSGDIVQVDERVYIKYESGTPLYAVSWAADPRDPDGTSEEALASIIASRSVKKRHFFPRPVHAKNLLTSPTSAAQALFKQAVVTPSAESPRDRRSNPFIRSNSQGEEVFSPASFDGFHTSLTPTMSALNAAEMLMDDPLLPHHDMHGSKDPFDHADENPLSGGELDLPANLFTSSLQMGNDTSMLHGEGRETFFPLNKSESDNTLFSFMHELDDIASTVSSEMASNESSAFGAHPADDNSEMGHMPGGHTHVGRSASVQPSLQTIQETQSPFSHTFFS